MTDMNIQDNTGGNIGPLSEGRLPVDAVTLGERAHVCASHGTAFKVHCAAVTPAGATDEFLYLLNGSATNQCVITSICFYAAGAEDVIVASCTGTAAGGALVTPINCLIGSTTAAETTVRRHTDITGLTPTTIDQVHLAATTETELLRDGPLVLMANTALCLTAVAGSIALNGTVSFYESSHPTAINTSP